jgi:hypothetical protein
MHHFRKIGMSAAAVALAASGIVAVFAIPASAKGGPHGKMTCTQISGSVNSGFITISGCTGSNSPGTGGSSQPIPFAQLVAGGTVNWVNGQSTTVTNVNPVTEPSKKAKKCPGYVKPTKTNPNPNEPSLISFTATVSADTTGLKLPGKAKGFVCVKNDSAGTISAPKPSKFS